MLAGLYLVIRIDGALEARRDLDVRSVFLGAKHSVLLEVRFRIPGPSQFNRPDSHRCREARGNLGRENILGRNAGGLHYVALGFVVDPLHVILIGLSIFSGGVHVFRLIRSCQQRRLLLLAGLGLIPGDLYEAASIDGASKIRQFFSLTLPLVMPTLLVALIFRTLDALRVFDIFYVMVGGQGNMATMAIYNQQWLVSFLDAGTGSAASVIILVIIMTFVVLYTRFSKTSFE